jgi:hypothetical protein
MNVIYPIVKKMYLVKKTITTGIGLDLDSIWFIVGLIVFKIEIPLCFENRWMQTVVMDVKNTVIFSFTTGATSGAGNSYLSNTRAWKCRLYYNSIPPSISSTTFECYIWRIQSSYDMCNALVQQWKNNCVFHIHHDGLHSPIFKGYAIIV